MKKVLLIVSFLLVLTVLLFACKKVPSDETLTPSGNETIAETLGELTTDTRSVIAESNAPSETRETEEPKELSETEETTKPVETQATEETEETDEIAEADAVVTQAPGDLELLANIPEADQSIVGQTQTIRLVDYYFIYLCNTETGEERLAVSHRGLCDSPMSYSTMTVYDVEQGGLEGLKAACEGEVSGTVLATAGIGKLDGFYFKGRIFSDYGRDPSEMFYAKDETDENVNVLQFYFGGYDSKKEDIFLKGNMVATVSEALQEDYDYTRSAYIERVGLLDAFDILSLNYGHYERLTWR
ncbi:MAG: hypothetical protein IJD10_05300 [Clostridia bacterium]|nr:hypothetical protein [Clostridia bacterium]